MHQIQDDARLQTIAGVELLNSSGLVRWDHSKTTFRAEDSARFEDFWKKRYNHPFGRLACWMHFSAGAEFLVKGVCLAHGLEIRTFNSVPAYPQGQSPGWSTRFCANWRSDGTEKVTNFGTLRNLTTPSKSAPSVLERLCNKVGASKHERDLVVASISLLQRSVRNRDAHAYVPNVRQGHHEIARDIMCDSFNHLVQWLPNGTQQVTDWMEDLDKFIASL